MNNFGYKVITKVYLSYEIAHTYIKNKEIAIKEMKLKINEIYHSIQGESTYMGMPCIFIRLTYCNLRCTYCDTEYAFYDGKEMTIKEILSKIKSFNCKTVEVTGGEPLAQDGCIKLLNKLISEGYKVLLETSGSISITKVPNDIIKIVDFKCPSSKMEDRNLWSIVDELSDNDQIKFVIGDRDDYEWSCKMIEKHNLNRWVNLFSPVFDKIKPKTIVEWILEDGIDVRFQLQMHKYIWNPEKQGV